jgi:hypothetical protein
MITQTNYAKRYYLQSAAVLFCYLYYIAIMRFCKRCTIYYIKYTADIY